MIERHYTTFPLLFPICNDLSKTFSKSNNHKQAGNTKFLSDFFHCIQIIKMMLKDKLFTSINQKNYEVHRNQSEEHSKRNICNHQYQRFALNKPDKFQSHQAHLVVFTHEPVLIIVILTTRPSLTLQSFSSIPINILNSFKVAWFFRLSAAL